MLDQRKGDALPLAGIGVQMGYDNPDLCQRILKQGQIRSLTMLVNALPSGSPALLMKLACLVLPRICCQKGPTLHFTYSSIARYPPAREEGASGRFFSGASSVIRNDQHPHHAVAIYVQTSDHFKGHEEHADVTAEMLLSRTSSA